MIFADQAGQVHARRWTNRQSGLSAVQDSTTTVLIVAEAMHGTASSDLPELIAAIVEELHAMWSHRAGRRRAQPVRAKVRIPEVTADPG